MFHENITIKFHERYFTLGNNYQGAKKFSYCCFEYSSKIVKSKEQIVITLGHNSREGYDVKVREKRKLISKYTPNYEITKKKTKSIANLDFLRKSAEQLD